MLKKIGQLSVTTKLLGVVLPLVVVPCLVTGLLGYIAAENIVTRLLNQAQIGLAKEIATQIDRDFKACQGDLKLISRLPVLEDYSYNMFYDLKSEAEINRKQVEEFFKDLARKSNLYYRISYLDSKGRVVACVLEGRITSTAPSLARRPLEAQDVNPSDKSTRISPVLEAASGDRLVVQMAQPLFDRWDGLAGMVIIDLDIEELGRRILARGVGREGYAFVMDNEGKTVVHPEPQHLGLLPEELGLPGVEKLIETMFEEEEGISSYDYHGQKIAAFTKAQGTGWVIAVTLPVTEFKSYVMVIKRQVLQIILVAASLALAAGIFFSWHFLKPIKKLARATMTITEGGLPRKVEVQSGDELGVLTHSFNQMVQNLRRVQEELVKSEKLVSLGRLAAGVAHEIRNPLNAIRVSLGMLQRKIKDQPQAMEFADVVSEEVYKLERFVSDFLSYAKQPPPKHTLTDINELVKEVIHSYGGLAKERGIIIQENFDPNLPMLPLDPFQMERAINNIVDNALEATREGGRLSVSTHLISTKKNEDSEELIEIRIKDNGKGMTSDELRNALDPFFTTKELGTGLGLPLTQSIIESHKGHFRILSKPNKWTAVIITLHTKLPNASGDIKYESL